MMKKEILWDILKAVDQVEVAFNQTLQTIDDIGQRYNMVSEMKQTIALRQQSYEAEIQAAITRPTFTKLSKRTKRKKRTKKRILWKMPKLAIKEDATTHKKDRNLCVGKELEQVQPSKELELIQQLETNEQDGIPFVCLQTNSIYAIGQPNSKPSYKACIRRLHNAAHKKLIAEAEGKDNGVDDMRHNHLTNIYDMSESDCDEYCCCSCRCQCQCDTY